MIKTKFLITGNLRSGTTFLSTLINSQDDACCFEMGLNTVQDIKDEKGKINFNSNLSNLNPGLVCFDIPLPIIETNSISKEKIINAINSIEFSKFEIIIQGVGVFPRTKSPRVIWVGVNKEGGQLISNLASLVHKRLLELGFKNDKPFKQHITIFRVKNNINDITDELTKFNSKIFGVQLISQIKLKKSTLTADGLIYEDLTVVEARR